MELSCSKSPPILVISPIITTNLLPDSNLELWGEMTKKETKKIGKMERDSKEGGI